MKKVIVFVLVSLVSVAVLLMLFEQNPQQDVAKEKNTTLRGVPVSFMEVSPQSYPANIKALGSVTPLWQTTIRAQVDGALNYINPALQPGNRVTEGELLVQIDARPYRAELFDIKSRLSHAKVAYLKEQNEANEARKNWERSGFSGKPVSELVFRKPQLDAARADIESAQAAIDYAQKKLQETNVTAPYDGIVISRTIDIKESLFVGDEIAMLFADERAEIPVKLDLLQWDRLPDPLESAKVSIIEPRLGTRWKASIKRLGQTLDRQSGLRTLYLEVIEPLKKRPPLLPGTFVEAHIEGKSYPNLLRIPETALTKRGYIWLIDEHDLLRSYKTKALFYGEGIVYVSAPKVDGTLRLAIKPNNSFVSAMRVEPIEQR